MEIQVGYGRNLKTADSAENKKKFLVDAVLVLIEQVLRCFVDIASNHVRQFDEKLTDKTILQVG